MGHYCRQLTLGAVQQQQHRVHHFLHRSIHQIRLYFIHHCRQPTLRQQQRLHHILMLRGMSTTMIMTLAVMMMMTTPLQRQLQWLKRLKKLLRRPLLPQQLLRVLLPLLRPRLHRPLRNHPAQLHPRLVPHWGRLAQFHQRLLP